ALAGTKVIDERKQDHMEWASSLTPVVVTASVLPPESMSVLALWRYTRHLDLNAQAAQRYEMQFWKKSVYPFVCFVMIALAL
ncbi:LptF/LptG family permease, partial [Enterococcus faecium]